MMSYLSTVMTFFSYLSPPNTTETESAAQALPVDPVEVVEKITDEKVLNFFSIIGNENGWAFFLAFTALIITVITLGVITYALIRSLNKNAKTNLESVRVNAELTSEVQSYKGQVDSKVDSIGQSMENTCGLLLQKLEGIETEMRGIRTEINKGLAGMDDATNRAVLNMTNKINELNTSIKLLHTYCMAVNQNDPDGNYLGGGNNNRGDET